MPTYDHNNPKPTAAQKKAASRVRREAQVSQENPVELAHQPQPAAGNDVRTPRRSYIPDTSDFVAVAIDRILGADDRGTIKLFTGNDGDSLYGVYRWRWGHWAGYYVMAVTDRFDLSYCLRLLAEKVADVEANKRVPTLDQWRGTE